MGAAAGQHVGRRVVGIGQLVEHIDCCCMLLAFKQSNIVAVNVCTVRQLLLRQAFGVPKLS